MLTKRQKQVLDFIQSFINKKDYAPSLEEIQKHLKLSSVSTIHHHLSKLEKEGFITRAKKKPRAIKIKEELVKIPLVGTISTGEATEIIENSETVKVSKSQLSKSGKHYALRVHGNSVIDEGIFEGDIVVIRKQTTAKNGEMVVALLDDNQVTLKKMCKGKNNFHVQHTNPDTKSISRRKPIIQGKVITIIKKLEDSKGKSLTHKVKYKQKNDFKNTGYKEGIFLERGLYLDHIYNTNCLDLMKKIKSDSIDLIFADPPYNLSKSSFKMKFVKSGGADLNTDKGMWDKFNNNDEYEVFTKKWLEEAYRILKNNGSIWVAGTYHNIYIVGHIMQKIGFDLLNEILWHKSDATPNLSCTRFVADHENFIWARKGKKHTFNYQKMKDFNGGKQMRSIWTKGKTAGGKKIHPTQKPEWLLERIILASSTPKEIVFDPFMGSGTTALVSLKANRHFLGSEINKTYYKQSLERLKKT